MATMNGAAYAAFVVRLSEPNATAINVAWRTEDGTGHAGTDYKASSGTVTFPPGVVEQSIQVEVYGRSPQDSTEDRTFLIRLDPPIEAILENATAECVITVVTLDGATFTQLYLPAGPQGRPGVGNTGLNTYELAKLNGYVGTLAQWLQTVTGRSIELINDGTWIKWRPQNTEAPQPWQNLVQLSTLKGAPGTNGTDGKQVQLQKSSTAIQWRLEGGSWADLVQLSDLKGAKGDPLNPRGDWVSGTTYNVGDYVTAIATNSTTAKSLYFLLGSASYVSTTPPKSDSAHWSELAAPQGVPGNNIELQKTATYIQWRVVGDSTWQNLVALADLTGAPGTPGTNGKSVELQKTSTYVQWRLVGDTTWQNLVAIADITGSPGATGKNIELQKGTTYIQWRVVGDTTWQNLVLLSDLTGAPGAAGTNGATWTSGAVAPSSANGANGDFYLRTDTSQIYQKSAGAWAVVLTLPSAAGIQWFSGTGVPSNTTGKDNDLHLHETTGEIRKRTTTSGTTSWGVIATIPKFATSAEAKAAASSTVAATPAGVREFIEQYGFTANYMNDSTDLNTITSTTDRTVCFGFNASTANTPSAGSYGRGIMIAGGGNYSTQIAWINTTGLMYIRFHNGTTWTPWSAYLLSTTNNWSGIQVFNGGIRVGDASPSTTGMEFGNVSGVATSPYIDFHSGATPVDYDARLISLGGNGTSGAGQVWLHASVFRPGDNNVTSLGDAATKWTTVYATNATISTSDARLKTDPREMTLAEITAFSAIARLPNLWKWIERVEEEGDAARLHSGPTVQAAIAIMEANGLEWSEYSCFCYDKWDAQEESTVEVDGKVKVLVKARDAGDKYSFRKEELLMLITRALAHKQDDLEARIIALEEKASRQ